MLRRLFALVVLLALLGGGLYLWKVRDGRLPGGREPITAIADARATLSVKTALSLRRGLRPFTIEVSTEGGVVTLRGELPAEELSAQAESTAAGVPGVRQIVNHLKVRPGNLPPESTERTVGETLDDEALAVQVRLALSLDRRLEGSDITVHAYRREVTLKGDTRSAEQRRRAVEIARDIPKVTSVRDELRVVDQTAPKGRRAAVERALAENPNLARYALSIREERGKLVLRGNVRTGAEKDLAGLLARDAAPGPIENAIEVRSDGS